MYINFVVQIMIKCNLLSCVSTYIHVDKSYWLDAYYKKWYEKIIYKIADEADMRYL